MYAEACCQLHVPSVQAALCPKANGFSQNSMEHVHSINLCPHLFMCATVALRSATYLRPSPLRRLPTSVLSFIFPQKDSFHVCPLITSTSCFPPSCMMFAFSCFTFKLGA